MSDKIKAADFELKEENKEAFKKSTIVRKNVETEFSLELIEDHEADLQKMKKELESQASLCGATVDNILRNHEFIKELSEEQIHHVWMYQENFSVKKNAEEKLVQVNDQLAQYKELFDTIYKKFGFVESGVASKIVRKDDKS